MVLIFDLYMQTYIHDSTKHIYSYAYHAIQTYLYNIHTYIYRITLPTLSANANEKVVS